MVTAELLGGAIAQITTANDNTVYRRGYFGSKQYVRVALTALNGGGELPIAATIVRGHPKAAPAM